MDEDVLDDATRRWVTAGLIDEETARAIRTFEAERDASGLTRRRLVWVLGTMGAVLVGAGILVFLVTRWGELPDLARTLLLLAAPSGAAAAGLLAHRRALPQVGRALWVLGALLVGPAVFGLAELHAPDFELAWRLVVWGAIALPMGHAFPSALAVALGLVALLAGAGSAATASGVWFVVGFLGTVVGAARLPATGRDPGLGRVYGLVGIAAGVGLFLYVSAMEGELSRIELAWDGVLAASAVLAAIVAAGLGAAAWTGRAEPPDASVGIAPFAGATAVTVLVVLAGDLNWLAAHLLVQAAFLGYVLAIAVIGVWIGSRWLINLGALGFLLLVLVNLVLLAGELTGAVALVVAGGVLVLAAVLLERGRRAFLARLDRS